MPSSPPHALRTPLTTIRGMADLILLRDALPLEARRDLEDIAAAGQRMSVTITALLDLARNEAQLVSGSHCSLREVLHDVAAHVDAGPVELAVDVDDLRLGVPHDLAVRAVSPVVENALRFASNRVVVGAAGAGSAVEIVVDDDGPGIAQDDPERIFEPGVTSSAGSGAGLGLAIARRIARTLGGEVTIAPRPGVTRFVVRLPRG